METNPRMLFRHFFFFSGKGIIYRYMPWVSAQVFYMYAVEQIKEILTSVVCIIFP